MILITGWLNPARRGPWQKSGESSSILFQQLVRATRKQREEVSAASACLSIGGEDVRPLREGTGGLPAPSLGLPHPMPQARIGMSVVYTE
jgi:hypothetical protein